MTFIIMHTMRRTLVVSVVLAAGLILLLASRVHAQEPARFEVLAGGIIGCVESCLYGVDIGGTGWLLDYLGGSVRVHKMFNRYVPAIVDLTVRYRGFTGSGRNLEVDIGFGRSLPLGAHYRSGWSGELLIGVRPYDRVGFKFGGGIETLNPRTTYGTGGFWRVSFLASVRP